MTKTGIFLIVAAVARLAAFGIASPAAGQTIPSMGDHLDAMGGEPTIVLASNVVRRPVFDSAGKAVNRLPGRSLGIPPKRAIIVCNGSFGHNVCHSQKYLPFEYQ